MKAYERRAAGIEVTFKVDAWDARIGAWRPGKGRKDFRSEAEAIASLGVKAGRYRVCRSEDGKTVEGEPFTVG